MRSKRGDPSEEEVPTGPEGYHVRMAAKLVESACGVAGSVAGAARHLAWYLSYCVDASATRSCKPPSAERAEPGAAARRVS
jgi:hypothetical protein